VWGRAAAAAAVRRQQHQPEPAATAALPPRWRCRSVGGYKRRPLGGCAFSGDGSLLAVAAGCTATLWDSVSNMLVGSLPAPGGLFGAADPLDPAPHPHEAAAAAAAATLGAAAATGLAGGAPQWQQQQQQQQQQQRTRPQLTQLAFSARSPHLAGLMTWPVGSARVGEEVLVVWDLLTLSVAYSCLVPHAVCLVADPAAPLFALGLNYSITKPQPGATAEEAPQPQQPEQPPQQPQQQLDDLALQQQSRAQKRAMRRGCVLLFSPDRVSPVFSSVLQPGAVLSALLPIPARTALSALVAQPAPSSGRVTPLLAVTEDRCYTIVAVPGDGKQQGAAAAAGADDAAVITGASESALEAVFGKGGGAQQDMLAGGDDVVDGRSTAKRVAALFDAPSHVLPPPSLLCPSLLELLVSSERS